MPTNRGHGFGLWGPRPTGPRSHGAARSPWRDTGLREHPSKWARVHAGRAVMRTKGVTGWTVLGPWGGGSGKLRPSSDLWTLSPAAVLTCTLWSPNHSTDDTIMSPPVPTLSGFLLEGRSILPSMLHGPASATEGPPFPGTAIPRHECDSVMFHPFEVGEPSSARIGDHLPVPQPVRVVGLSFAPSLPSRAPLM